VVQTTAPTLNTGAEEGSAASSVDETLVVHPMLEVATTQNAIRTSSCVTSEMMELLVHLPPILVRVTSVLIVHIYYIILYYILIFIM